MSEVKELREADAARKWADFQEALADGSLFDLLHGQAFLTNGQIHQVVNLLRGLADG